MNECCFDYDGDNDKLGGTNKRGDVTRGLVDIENNLFPFCVCSQE